MQSKRGGNEAGHQDRRRAQREKDATEVLIGLGADVLSAPPWRPPPVPPSATDLANFALSLPSDPESAGLLSALTLLPAARAEVEALESGLLFAARSAGLTWSQIADAMGFNSPQACQQHYNRLSNRQTTES